MDAVVLGKQVQQGLPRPCRTAGQLPWNAVLDQIRQIIENSPDPLRIAAAV
jgi:hypothetical protein